MTFRFGPKVPENLRPFYPFFPEEDNSSQLILNKNISPRVFTLLVVALINLVPIFIFPDYVITEGRWTYYSGFVVFLVSAVLHLLEDRYSRIEVSVLGITLVRKLLFFNTSTLINRSDIQSIQFHQKKWNSESAYGRLSIKLVQGKDQTLLEIRRSTIDDVSKDIRIIASQISGLLLISSEPLLSSD